MVCKIKNKKPCMGKHNLQGCVIKSLIFVYWDLVYQEVELIIVCIQSKWVIIYLFGHIESKLEKKMDVLEVAMKRHNFNRNSSSSNTSSHRHALSTFSFSFHSTYTPSSYGWLSDSIASYRMDKIHFFS